MSPDPRAGGLLLADKPAGVTSRAVAARALWALTQAYPQLRARRRRGAAPGDARFRVGHGGTLDPLATGLLVLLLGRASRLSPYLLGMDKTYLATVRFGAATDTLDADGEVTATAPPPAGGPAAVAALLPRFTGIITQVPPVYSAIKRDGRSLHIAARAGQDVAEPSAREVTIHALRLLAARWDGERPEVDLEIACSSGTYVRSLARDLAVAAGSLGHVAALRRTVAGPFTVERALPGVMDADGAALAAAIIPARRALPHLPEVPLTAEMARAVRNGRQPPPEWHAALPPACAQAQLVTDDDLVAVVERDGDGVWRLDTVLPAVEETRA